MTLTLPAVLLLTGASTWAQRSPMQTSIQSTDSGPIYNLKFIAKASSGVVRDGFDVAALYRQRV
jgi:hypothetical protein